MTLLRALLLAFLTLGAAPAAEQGPVPASLTVAADGIAARYYAAPGGSTGAAVLMLNGSDGGYPSRAAAEDLAAAGHPVLALAYFSGFAGPIPGLPASLERIELDYVYRGLDWLHVRLGAGRPVVVMGTSRGAELALLVASRRADVAGVAAFAPTALVWSAVGDRTGTVPAWLEGGRPVPHVTLPVTDPAQQFAAGLAAVDQVARAAIPLERAHGPVLLVSSRSDALWPSAAMADMIAARMRGNGFRHAITNLQYDDASHNLLGPGPGLVRFQQGSFSFHFGGSEEGTLRARTAAWAETKRFLGRIGRR